MVEVEDDAHHSEQPADHADENDDHQRDANQDHELEHRSDHEGEHVDEERQEHHDEEKGDDEEESDGNHEHSDKGKKSKKRAKKEEREEPELLVDTHRLDVSHNRLDEEDIVIPEEFMEMREYKEYGRSYFIQECWPIIKGYEEQKNLKWMD